MSREDEDGVYCFQTILAQLKRTRQDNRWEECSLEAVSRGYRMCTCCSESGMKMSRRS